MPVVLRRRRLLGWLIATLLVTTAVPATAALDAASESRFAGSPGDSPVVSADGPSAVDPSFETEGVEYVPRGGVASIPVSMADGENATFSVTTDDGNHSATFAVRDRNGDGTATVQLNTYDGRYRVSDGDNLTVRSASGETTPLAAGVYELLACSGNRSDCDQEAAAAATRITVGERSTDRLRTWVAPESADLSNLSAVDAALSSGNLTRSGVVARNDTLVLELRASGLAGAIATQDGRNVTERFFEFLRQENGSLEVYDVPGTSQERAYFDLTDASAVTVVQDAQNFSYYVAVDLGEVRVTDGHGGEPANNPGRWGGHDANVTLGADSPLTADGRESATTEFSIDEAEAALDMPARADQVYLAPAPNQTVFGTTTLAPGSEVTVEVRRDDGEFSRTRTIRVRNRTDGPGRSFAAAFDLGGLVEGTDLDVIVRSRSGSRLTDPYVDGDVVAQTAALDLTDRGLTSEGVPIENATLSHGGYVAVHRGSADGKVVGRTERLAPGESVGRILDFDSELDRNATLVAVAHRAAPGDALGRPYTENESLVAGSVELTVEQSTVTTTPADGQTGEPTDSTATKTTTTPETETTRTPSPETGIPGFGVGAALVALLAGLALARRK